MTFELCSSFLYFCGMLPTGNAFRMQIRKQFLMIGIIEFVFRSNTEVMSFYSFFTWPFLKIRRKMLRLHHNEVTFLTASAATSGTFTGLLSRGGYFISTGTMSLRGKAALKVGPFLAYFNFGAILSNLIIIQTYKGISQCFIEINFLISFSHEVR